MYLPQEDNQEEQYYIEEADDLYRPDEFAKMKESVDSYKSDRGNPSPDCFIA